MSTTYSKQSQDQNILTENVKSVFLLTSMEVWSFWSALFRSSSCVLALVSASLRFSLSLCSSGSTFLLS